MKTGSNSDTQFEKSGDIHDAVNAEVSEVGKKYSSPPAADKVYEPYDPLNSEAADNKSYAKPNIPISQEDMLRPIPEPIHQPPPRKPKEEPKLPPKEPITPVNPEIAQLPPKEKELAAKKAAQMAIMGYKVVHNVANWSVKINEGKLKRLDRKKIIDLRIPIPISPQTTLSMGEFVQAYNSEVGDAFSVSKEFEDEVTPILERIMNKRGIGATDEQMLIGIVAIDLAAKGAKWAELMKSRSDMINQLKDLTAAYKGGRNPNMQPAQSTSNHEQAQQQQSSPQQQPTQSQPQSQAHAPIYEKPPTPPRFDDEEIIEIAEIIPNDVEPTYIDVIPESPQIQHDITEYQEEVKQKRQYKKREPKSGDDSGKQPAHRPKGRRNRIDD